MSSRKISFKVSSYAEIVAGSRKVHGINGVINGRTKVQSNKGKKAYNRQKSKDFKNWDY